LLSLLIARLSVVKIATYSYFLFAPTLTFETEFPRTPKMSWKRVIEYAIMFLLAALAIYIVCTFNEWLIMTKTFAHIFHTIVTYNLMPAWRLVRRSRTLTECLHCSRSLLVQR